MIRFNKLLLEMPNVTASQLSNILKNLEEQKIVQKKIFQSSPPKVEYSLTEYGIELMHAISPFIAWADKNFDNHNHHEKISAHKIIVVDDDPKIVESLSDSLTLMGFSVIGKAYGGLEGLELFSALDADVIIVDVIMPPPDGLTIMKEMKQLNKNTRIIALTGDTTEDTKNILQEIDISDIIYKPFSLENIKELFVKYENS